MFKLGFNTTSTHTKFNDNSDAATVILARVVKVILGPNNLDGTIDEDFKKYGEWDSIGAIRFTVLYGTLDSKDTNVSVNIAKPLSNSIRVIPVKGEVVEIKIGPSQKLNENSSAIEYYYTNPYNIWNAVNYNGFPDLIDYTSEIQNGSYNLGYTFIEKSNINSVKSYEGDILIEGRWGNTVRIGSTVPGTEWEKDSKVGDPIIIISTRKETNAKSKWDLVNENTSLDTSGIYICSTQSIPIPNFNNYNFDTYSNNLDNKTTIVR